MYLENPAIFLEQALRDSREDKVPLTKKQDQAPIEGETVR